MHAMRDGFESSRADIANPERCVERCNRAAGMGAQKQQARPDQNRFVNGVRDKDQGDLKFVSELQQVIGLESQDGS